MNFAAGSTGGTARKQKVFECRLESILKLDRAERRDEVDLIFQKAKRKRSTMQRD